MIEKEAEEYANQSCFTEMLNPSLSESIDISDDIKEAVLFGYNKANEWHYPSKGEFPKDEKYVQVLYQVCDKINTYNCIYDIHAENWLYYNLDNMVLELFTFDVIAWKEIVLPELKESK